MNIDKIKKLPKEFNFRSTINPYRITYHAKEMKTSYEVSWDFGNHIEKETYSKEEVRRRLLKGDFVICK